MRTNGINSFMNSSTHSTCPIVLTILNLSLWLCNKQKYVMMLELISGPQQPGNGIDTYFRPLVEDLKEPWYNDGVQVWDEHKHEYFGLKVILFVTVSDSPLAHNLSGQSKKIGCADVHIISEKQAHNI
jgi:hypothetical protein